MTLIGWIKATKNDRAAGHDIVTMEMITGGKQVYL